MCSLFTQLTKWQGCRSVVAFIISSPGCHIIKYQLQSVGQFLIILISLSPHINHHQGTGLYSCFMAQSMKNVQDQVSFLSVSTFLTVPEQWRCALRFQQYLSSSVATEVNWITVAAEVPDRRRFFCKELLSFLLKKKKNSYSSKRLI